jgi:predicted phosphodiesterase
VRRAATGSFRRSIVVWLLVVAVASGACTDDAPNGGRSLGPTRVPSESTPTPDASASGGPASAPGLSFAVVGDFGTGELDQREVAERMCRWRRSNPYDLVLTTGDNVYPHGEPGLIAPRFLEPYACLLDEGVRFRAVLGNHDVETDGGRAQLREPAFGMPARNYVFRRSGVRFVMVDSNDLRLGWLERAVEPQADDAYTVVVMHHPVYSPGKHGSTPGYQPSLPRLFQDAGVDLVLSGHDHLYSVTESLGGVRYVVTGGGGARTYICSDRSFVDVCRAGHHFLYVDIDPRRILVRAVPTSGEAFDRFRVPKAD